MCSLIRGTARPEDVGKLAAAVHLKLIELQSRVWYEWIDSNSNPADGLSRLGLEDPWTVAQGWDLHEGHIEDWEALYSTVPSFLREAATAADTVVMGRDRGAPGDPEPTAGPTH